MTFAPRQFLVQPNNGAQAFYVFAAEIPGASQQFLVYPLTQGSGGNSFQTTSLIVDMGFPRAPADSSGISAGPTSDRSGRTIRWDD